MLTGYEDENNIQVKRETYVNGELTYSVRHVGIHDMNKKGKEAMC